MTETRNVSRYCIYTMRHTDQLKYVHSQGGGAGTFEENKRWVEGEKLFNEAKKNGERMPILFAAAEKESGPLCYAMLTDLRLDPNSHKTRYSFTGLTPFYEDRPKSSLIKKSDGKPLSDNYIRPYAICLTPSL